MKLDLTISIQTTASTATQFGQLALAAALGAVVGFEREYTGKSAGLRTNILICLGAALLTQLSFALTAGTAGDPSRVAANIVTGIGFLGAGSILQQRHRVRGLTTAATIWVVAAMGMAVGAGEYAIAIGTAVLILLINWPLGVWERRMERHPQVKPSEDGSGEG